MLEASNLIYLDNGATSFPKPPEVYDFMDRFYRHYGVNPGRSGYDICIESGNMVEETRRMLCRFFGGTVPERVVFGQNATDALNLSIFGLLRPGDHAITTHLEHNSVIRPLWHLQEEGVEVDWVDFDDRGYVDPEEIARRIRPNTKAVVMNHGSNVIGTVQPVGAVGRICRDRGIPLVVDVSQTAGMIPIDMEAMSIDVVCFTGHKSLMGPMGVGGMCVRDGLDIRHTRAGGTGVRSAQRRHLDEYPYRMEYGTPNLPGIAGLHAGVKWVLQRGIDAIHAHEMALWKRLRDGLAAIDGVILYCQDSAENHTSVLAWNVEGMEAGDAGTMLDVDYDIACRTGLHCAPMVHEHLGTDKIHGAVRFAIGAFNTEAEIDHAIRAVEAIVGTRKKGRNAGR
ncbi:MAG: aminotransferase class V-fold PLP-dependent enzyme [Candidatus Eisenbacteria bacterium]|nr:aminotransferase class V-fold PLP-dependent enzyme [Candidatus Eisenbacteria bacterium]